MSPDANRNASSNAPSIPAGTARRTTQRIAAEHANRNARTYERTNALTKNNSPFDVISRNATPAGGQPRFPRHIEEWLTKETRAAVLRTGERPEISKTLRELVYRRDRHTCQSCGRRPWAHDSNRRSGPLHLDHIVPWSAGGPDTSWNLRTLCHTCNADRSNWVSQKDNWATPIARICAPCLAATNPQIQRYCETTNKTERFNVYCASRQHDSWALPRWSLL